MSTKAEGDTPATNERLAEIAELFRDCRAALRKVSHETLWQPTNGSFMEYAKNRLDKLPATKSGQSQFVMVSDVIQTFLVTSAEHLGGVSALYDAGEVFVSPPALVRSALENAAQAVWVIGTDRNPEAVLARAYIQEHLSAIEANKAAGRMGGKAGAEATLAKQRLSTIRAEIKAVFPDASFEALGANPPTLAGQTLLSPEKSVTAMFDLLAAEGGGTVSGKGATGMYDFLSNHTHPTLYALRQLRVWSEHEDHAHGEIVIDGDFLERVATVAVVGNYTALTLAVGAYGLDRSAVDVLTDQIDEKLPQVFRTSAGSLGSQSHES